MAMFTDDMFDKYIVLKTGFGNVHDSGYGYTYEDIVAIAQAINASSRPDAKDYDVWIDVERRAKRKRVRTVDPC